MHIYLPIAEMPINILLILGMGGGVGFLSGLFGIGGGFLLTPALIFLAGIPPAVSVATVTSQIVASSASGVASYYQRRAIDFKLAFYLLMSGIMGSVAGAFTFEKLRQMGQLDLTISLSYVLFLGTVGLLMLFESTRAIRRRRKDGKAPTRRNGHHNWIHGLPFKVRFRHSKIYISVIPIVVMGAVIGFIGTVLGIGGGFMMVPALIYLLRIPTLIAIGTSLLQILVTMGSATIMHAATAQTVDVFLGLVLMLGGVVGAQFGARLSPKLNAELFRFLLGLIVLLVGGRFAWDLLIKPEDLFSLTVVVGS